VEEVKCGLERLRSDYAKRWESENWQKKKKREKTLSSVKNAFLVGQVLHFL